jgi:hypothetical protein
VLARLCEVGGGYLVWCHVRRDSPWHGSLRRRGPGALRRGRRPPTYRSLRAGLRCIWRRLRRTLAGVGRPRRGFRSADPHDILGALVVVCGVLVIVGHCRPFSTLRKGRAGKKKGMKAVARNLKGEPAVACDFAAMDDEQRKRYRALRRRLGEDCHEAQELEDGYAFRHSSEEAVLVALAEYVSLERLCCPFFDFAIEIGRGGGEVWLRMTGPEGAKGILEAEMGGEARGATAGEPD